MASALLSCLCYRGPALRNTCRQRGSALWRVGRHGSKAERRRTRVRSRLLSLCHTRVLQPQAAGKKTWPLPGMGDAVARPGGFGGLGSSPLFISLPFPASCLYIKVSVHCQLPGRGGDEDAEPTGLESPRRPAILVLSAWSPKEQLPLSPVGHLGDSGGVAAPVARGWAAIGLATPSLFGRQGKGAACTHTHTHPPGDGRPRGGSYAGGQSQGQECPGEPGRGSLPRSRCPRRGGHVPALGTVGDTGHEGGRRGRVQRGGVGLKNKGVSRGGAGGGPEAGGAERRGWARLGSARRGRGIMNRFKASKFRHTEARLPRREVSAVGRSPPSGTGVRGWRGRGSRRAGAGRPR